ncbi:beta-N-acetylhexosaminidase [Glaciihabitans arcticus]|uniref:beta-N-acetylhexosaminidase n=1 Tax=Glaciihabitans arcticus TaxID=2668039 RepID=A0A4Q9GRV4_9MICO|nr:family 20 glycosylhydrolase [Glaciihabitans arcticus]TBN57712.1 beta-N-acetylhexosaminidase [Glaciihabitans arcticus]
MTLIVPAPVSSTPGLGAAFGLGPATRVQFHGSGAEPVARYLGNLLELPVVEGDEAGSSVIQLTITPGERVGAYDLAIDVDAVTISADDPSGLFYGAQSLRQLLPEGLPVTISDAPRFAYRGAMLDVARHFFPVADVKRYIDAIAQLKLNYLHLHLTDDQGWRLEIDGWPELTAIGASTAVNGDPGGFYTQADYTEIVEYAASRFVTIVPEIDVPGHTNAALVAYPSLGGGSYEPYEGVEVGFSSLAIRSEETYLFLDDVFRQVSAITPGPYLHLGGDESLSTTDEDFLYFAERAAALAASHGKTVIGWHELGRSRALPRGTVGQYWGFTTPEDDSAASTTSFVEQGGSVIFSPADVAYLDMKYADDSRVGVDWARGVTSLEEAASWDPLAIIPDLAESHILGLEAPIWTETLPTIEDVEWLAFPRIAAIAEIAWSPRTAPFDELAPRLAAFARHLDAAGTHYFRAPEVDWLPTSDR